MDQKLKRDLVRCFAPEISERRIMSVFKQKNSIASVEFKKFKGIDTRAPHRETGAAYDMVNFRVLPDGSLEKRCGFEPITTRNFKIRGLWSGNLGDTDVIFIASGNTVTKILPKEKNTVNIGTLDTSEGDVNFMFFNGILYLSDGKSFYTVSENMISNAEGYVPLYGKDWPIRSHGEVNEPLNLASRHIRMTYVVNEELSFLFVDHIISSIDAVYINDVLITDTNRYFFDEGIMSICLSGLKLGDRVALYLTVDESEINKADLLSCKQSAVYGDYTDNILFLWDGDKKNVMFESCSVSDSSLEEARVVYPDSLPFYVPTEAAFKMPGNDDYITGVCRQYDRLLIFTKDNTWMGNISSSPRRTLEAVTVNPYCGCSSVAATVMCENNPVCVSDGSIVRWTAETDELNETNAYSISSKIEAMLPPSFFTNAITLIDKRHSEIFFADPTDTQGKLWIYNYKSENWYKFDGINADKLFLFDGSLGFIDSNAVFIFNDSLGYDKLKNTSQRRITAFFESHPTDFSVSGNKKRLCGMTLNANLAGADISTEYISAGNLISTATLLSNSLYPTSFIKRLQSKRFCYLTLRIVSSAKAIQRIYSTGIWVKP